MIDPTLERLVDYQDRYRLAVTDAATYRRMFLLLLDMHQEQTKRMARTEERLRQVMGVESWQAEP